MAELQQFADAVPVAGLGAPIDAGFDPGEGIGDALRTFGRSRKAEKDAAAAAEAAAAGTNIAIDNLEQENRKTFSALQNDVGFNMKEMFKDVELEEGLARLDQLDGIGMSTKAQIRRNLLAQQALRKYPGQAEQIAKRAGLDLSDSSFDTQGEQTKQEREAVEATAKTFAEIRASYGDTRPLDPVTEVEQWAGSAIAKQEGQVRRWEQIARSDTASKDAKSGATRILLSNRMGDDLGTLKAAMEEVVGQKGANRAQQQSAVFGYLNTIQQNLSELYPTQPELIKAHMAIVQSKADQYLPLLNGSQEQRDAALEEIDWQIGNHRAIDLAEAQLGLTQSKVRDAMTGVKVESEILANRESALRTAKQIKDMQISLGGVYDDVLDGLDIDSDLASLLAVGSNGTADTAQAAFESIADPSVMTEFQQSRAFEASLDIMFARPEVEMSVDSAVALTDGMMAWMEDYPRGSRRRVEIERQIMEMSQKPEFLKRVADHPVLAELAAPVASSLRNELGAEVQGMLKQIAGDRVNMVGAQTGATGQAILWEQLGQYVVTDTAAMAKDGTFRLSLRPGVHEVLTPAGVQNMSQALVKYNLRAGHKYSGRLRNLAKLEGHGDTALSFRGMTEGTQNFDLAGLSDQTPLVEDNGENIRGFIDDAIARAFEREKGVIDGAGAALNPTR